MIRILLLVLLSEVFLTAGHVLMKRGAHVIPSSSGMVAWAVALLRRPAVIGGLSFMFIGLICWFYALSAGQLTFVYALGSIQYILSMFASAWFLGERIDRMKLLGTLLITAGIGVIALTGGR